MRNDLKVNYMTENIVEMKHITKKYRSLTALDDISFQIQSGKIYGLIGENGSGKSTLIKIITGAIKSDEGEIYINGVPKMTLCPRDAYREGIVCVYQELTIIPYLSVTDNIFMNNGIYFKKIRLLDYSSMNKKAKEIINSFGIDIDVTLPCNHFSIEICQLIEIARALNHNAKLIVLDEPTACMGKKEIELLFIIIRSLKEKGIAFLFVSHKLEEMLEICDEISVIRDGKQVLTRPTNLLDQNQIVLAMLGHSMDSYYPKICQKRGKEAIRLENVSTRKKISNLNLSAYYGEILGIAGRTESGQKEIGKVIFGLLEKTRGVVYVNGEKVNNKTPNRAKKNKIAYITDDRTKDGLFVNDSILSNIMITAIDELSKFGVINYKLHKGCTKKLIEELNIRCVNMDMKVLNLSGGNQQKVVLGKWINMNANIYIFNEPTRGIDIASKLEVYKIINTLIDKGKCIILISSELMELVTLSNRIVVMNKGELIEEIDKTKISISEQGLAKVILENILDE